MERSYWLRLGRRAEGPFTLDELRLRAARGTLTPAHSVSEDGKVWRVAARCPGLFDSASQVAPAKAEGGSAPITAAESLEPAIEERLAAPASLQQAAIDDPDEELSDAKDARVRTPIEDVAEPVTLLSESEASLADRAVLAWPAQVACIGTLLLSCGIPMARDVNGALWWWSLVRLWQLGGAGLCIAAIGWACIAICVLMSTHALWRLRGSEQAEMVSRCSTVSIACACVAWSGGMACGAWTVPQCIVLVLAIWTALDSSEIRESFLLPASASNRVGPGWVVAGVIAGVASIGVSIAAIAFREGSIPTMVAILGIASGLAMIGTVVRRRTNRWQGWATLLPAGTAAISVIAVLTDGVAALWSTPEPPVAGTRFAVLDSVRVCAVLLCQCMLAYLATCLPASSQRHR